MSDGTAGMAPAAKGMRLHIGLYGRRNAGKSSLLNALANQDVAIVAPLPGTTTDPVEKALELQPLGPVVLIDTAGLDDEGEVGRLRVRRSLQALERTDLAVVVASADAWGEPEEALLRDLAARRIPAVVALNRDDLAPAGGLVAALRARGLKAVATSAPARRGIDALRELLLESAPAELIETPTMLGGLVAKGELVVLVMPIDKEAPKGRLILPQAQAVREVLDREALCVVVRENELRGALALLKAPPVLVVTDSQAFEQVSAIVPPEVPLTGFSVLLSRMKGDLAAQAEGARAIDALRPGDRVLVAEACSHHPIGEDIGRVKIPRWLQARAGGALRFDTVAGRDFPEDLSPYRLVVHCGGCTFNRRAMLSRIARCRAAGVPITNYGLAIAHVNGILERAMRPFERALADESRPAAARPRAPGADAAGREGATA